MNYPSTYLYEEALVWMYHSAGTTPGNDGFSGNTRNTAQWGQHDVHMIPGPGRFIQNNRLFYTAPNPGVPDDNHIYRFGMPRIFPMIRIGPPWWR